MNHVFFETAERFLGRTQAAAPAPSLLDMLFLAAKAQDLLKGQPVRTAIRVAVIAGSIARRLGLDDRTVNAIAYAALIHDLGLAQCAPDIYTRLKVGESEKRLFTLHPLLNARIIGNPHQAGAAAADLPEAAAAAGEAEALPLTSYQTIYNFIATHPQAGGRLVSRFGLSDDVRAIVEAHHELCDGSGYPFGLTREQIPLGARILTLAECVEGVMAEVTGLTSRQHALDNFLTLKTHGRFDPDVVAAFQGVLTDYPDFLRLVNGLDVEDMCRAMVVERTQGLDGETLLAIVETLGELPDQLLPLYFKGHAQSVAKLSVQMAEQMGISRQQSGELLVAAYLHDIGMLAVPMAIQMKQNALSDEERRELETHAHWTETLLKGIPGFDNVALWASEHHERMNGRGYPLHKKGFEISAGGRIIALADVYDALTSPRPYRTHAMEPLDALPVLGQGRFSQYDNHLVSVLRRTVMEAEVPIRLA